MLKYRRYRKESLSYDRNGDYPIQTLLEWFANNDISADLSDGADLEGFTKRLERLYVYLNDSVIQPALRTLGYIKDSMTSRRQYLTASEKKECREALQDVFDEFNAAQEKLVNDRDRQILHDKAYGDANGQVKKSPARINRSSSDYLTSVLRACSNWVYDNRKDNEEVAFYQTNLLDCFRIIEDALDDIYTSSKGSDAGYFLSPDIPFVLEDSSLPHSLEVFKKPGKVSVEDFNELLEELERVDGVTESQFDFSFEALDNTFGQTDELDEFGDALDTLYDLWDKITDTIEGWPNSNKVMIRRR